MAGRHLFICYSHEDAEEVRAEISFLESQELQTWSDAGIHVGSEWTDDIATALNSCDKLIFFVTPSSVASRHCRNEVQYAVDAGKPLIVVYLAETELPDGLRLAIGLTQSLHKYELTESEYRDRLKDALQRNVPSIPPRRSVAHRSIYTVWIAVALGIGIAVWIAYRDTGTSDAIREQAHKHYLLGKEVNRRERSDANKTKAASYFRAAIDADPTYVRGYAGLCITHLKYTEIEEAEAICFEGAKVDDQYWEMQLALGNLLTDQGNYERAVAELDSALQEMPDNPEVNASLGWLYLSMGQTERAIHFYQRAVDLEPGYFRRHTELAGAYFANSQYRKAITVYGNALLLGPPNADSILVNIGQSHSMFGEFEKAQEAYEKALAINTQNSVALSGLANSYYYQGCLNRAARAGRQSVDIEPERVEAWFDLGAFCDLVEGGYQFSRLAYQRALSEMQSRKDNPSLGALGRLAEAYAQLGMEQLALETVDELLARSDNGEAWYWTSIVHQRVGRDNTSLEARSNAIERGMPQFMFAQDPSLNPEMICKLPPIEPSCDPSDPSVY